jgi:HEAT repeat protein
MLTRNRLTALVLAAAFWCGCGPETCRAQSPGEVKALIEKLKDRDETVRLKAAKELGKLKEKAKAAIPALTEATKDADEDVRAVAKKSLAAIKESLGEANRAQTAERLQPIVADLRSKDQGTKLAAIERLGAMGSEARDAGADLVEYGMLDTSPKVRDEATAAFEKIDPAVYKEVLTVLLDKSIQKRVEAVKALQGMGAKAKAAVPALKNYHESLMKGRPPRVELHALEAMATIAPDDASVQSVILGHVGGPDARDGGLALGSNSPHRTGLVRCMNLTRADNGQKYKALMAGLAATKVDHVVIINELAKLGADAKDALPTLTKLKTHSNAKVREAAGAAVAAIKD